MVCSDRDIFTHRHASSPPCLRSRLFPGSLPRQAVTDICLKTWRLKQPSAPAAAAKIEARAIPRPAQHLSLSERELHLPLPCTFKSSPPVLTLRFPTRLYLLCLCYCSSGHRMRVFIVLDRHWMVKNDLSLARLGCFFWARS